MSKENKSFALRVKAVLDLPEIGGFSLAENYATWEDDDKKCYFTKLGIPPPKGLVTLSYQTPEGVNIVQFFYKYDDGSRIGVEISGEGMFSLFIPTLH